VIDRTITNPDCDIPVGFAGAFGVLREPNGLYYMNARYYDPTLGRFLSEDPLGLGGGDLTLYSYAGNNPVVFVDPSGLCSQKNGFTATISKAWNAHQQFHDDIRNNVSSLGESTLGVYAGTESAIGITGVGGSLTIGGGVAIGTGTVAGAATGFGLIVIGTETIWVGIDILLGITKGPTKKK
jgi:RHS repeat-associated protein